MILEFNSDITEYFNKLKKTIDAISVDSINNLLNVLLKARNENHTIFIMGNGGSAATASHFVCDFNKGLAFEKQKRFRFICLNDNIPSLMAYANDISYEEIFIEQLKNLFQPGDIVIGISGSGNSMNVIKALEFANDNNGVTIGLTGYNGGKVMKLAMHNVNIPIDDMQITEDLHMVLDHCMMKILCDNSNKL